MTAKIRLLAKPPVPRPRHVTKNVPRLRASGRLRKAALIAMAECQVHPSNPWAGDCSRYGLAPDLTSSRVPRIRRSPVIVGLVPSLVGRKSLRGLVAIVASFGNYGLTLERRSIV